MSVIRSKFTRGAAVLALAGAVALPLVATPQPAEAWWRHGGWGGWRGGGWGGGWRGGWGYPGAFAGAALLGLGVGAAVASTYPYGYYAPPPVVYAPPPPAYYAPGYYYRPY